MRLDCKSCAFSLCAFGTQAKKQHCVCDVIRIISYYYSGSSAYHIGHCDFVGMEPVSEIQLFGKAFHSAFGFAQK